MLDCLAVDRISYHFHKGFDPRILGDEAQIPALLAWPDQHEFELAPPDDLATETREYRGAVTAIGSIGFRAGRAAPVGIGRTFPKPEEIEHVDRTFAGTFAKRSKCLLGGVDMA